MSRPMQRPGQVCADEVFRAPLRGSRRIGGMRFVRASGLSLLPPGFGAASVFPQLIALDSLVDVTVREYPGKGCAGGMDAVLGLIWFGMGSLGGVAGTEQSVGFDGAR
jgi:hypothetical protein